MRTLIHFSSHIRTREQATLLTAQFNLCRHLNPDADICIIDSCSQIPPMGFLPGTWNAQRLLDDDHIPTITAKNTLLGFKDAIGHPYHDKLRERAGPCRAWMKGIEVAIASGYERVVYYEYDLLCRRPVADAFAQMKVPVGTGGKPLGEQFDEVGLFYASVDYLWRSDFVKRYNWRGPTTPLGEVRMMALLDADGARQILDFKGNRDRFVTTPDNYEFSYGTMLPLDYLTHAKPETLHHFLAVSGLGHCWPGEVPVAQPNPVQMPLMNYGELPGAVVLQ